jgi:hypothetical protein
MNRKGWWKRGSLEGLKKTTNLSYQSENTAEILTQHLRTIGHRCYHLSQLPWSIGNTTIFGLKGR